MSDHPLSEESFARALRFLCRRDSDLARIVKQFGPPPLWAREPGFGTLVHIILEQQVSLASARAAYQRLGARISPLTPARFLELDDATLKQIGFSRQKSAYARNLAQALVDGALDLKGLAKLNDAAAHAELLKLKGIGNWTAGIYLLMALRRPDILPRGDLALDGALRKIKRLRARPSAEKLEKIAENWKPYRAVAARILWHYYLSSGKNLQNTSFDTNRPRTDKRA
ncbi:MAG: DNA-3-methyladenine glycosylase 2 family protein [Chloroflexi bacterium]|nr:DNA-3-methyladenine glycosylase 2 family protein [Chloroflexota bacterium]